MTRILIPGLDLKTSRRALELATEHPNVFAAMGIHPSETLSYQPAMLGELRTLRAGENRARIVAIGEIGLDYYWDDAPHDWQQVVLNHQLSLAAELNLPVILHMREAKDVPDGDCARDMLNILELWVSRLRSNHHSLAHNPGVLHSFSGSRVTASRALEMNF